LRWVSRRTSQSTSWESNGVALKNQMAQASYKVDILQEWARANNLTWITKLTQSLVATTTDQATVTQGRAPTCGIFCRMPDLT
jgi:16S rRNA G527 N7-methylase RsmG